MANIDIDYTLSVRAEGGPYMQKTGTNEVQAMTVIKTTVPKNSGTSSVAIQPITINGASFITMYSDNYTSLTYTVDGGASHVLNAPMMLIGSGAVAFLGATQYVLLFTNAGAVSDANVEIFIGRDETSVPLG